MHDHREAFVTVNGVALWTVRHGDGPPLVLLHGGPGLWDCFEELGEMVGDLAEVHRYDQRGSGRSAGGQPYTVEQFTADLDALRAHWGHDRWAVGGHSAGANLALAYALAHPERVTGLLYLSGTGVIRDWRDESHAAADARRTPDERARLAELNELRGSGAVEWTLALDQEYCRLTWIGDFADRETGLGLLDGLVGPFGPNYEVNAAIGREWNAAFADGTYVARLREINVPTLVLHGEHDPRPVRLAERLATMLPRSELVVVPKAGHWPWLEQPDLVRPVVRDFLRDLHPVD